MEIASKFITPGLIFLLTIAFGFWLSNSGKPYNGLLFNLHKLIALAGVIITALQLNKILKTTELQPLILIFLIAAVLSIVALFLTGAMMSTGQLSYARMLSIHRVAPFLVVFATGILLYLLLGQAGF